MGDGFDDVFEMILDLSLGNAEHLSQLVRGQACADQQFDHALAGRACGSEHTIMVGESAMELKRNLADAKVVSLGEQLRRVSSRDKTSLPVAAGAYSTIRDIP